MPVADFKNHWDYPEAVIEGFKEDLVVVRGLASQEFTSLLHSRIYGLPGLVSLRPMLLWQIHRYMPELHMARAGVKDWIKDKLGAKALFLSFGTIQKPNLIQQGGAETHVDIPSNITVTSINLGSPTTQEPTVVYAERVTDPASPGYYIEEVAALREVVDHNPQYRVELEPGDAVIFSRGVEHKIEAPEDRTTLMIATRTFASI